MFRSKPNFRNIFCRRPRGISRSGECKEAALDTASVQLISTLVIILGLLSAKFALMWQMNSQSGGLDEKIDAQSEDMDAQGKEIEA